MLDIVKNIKKNKNCIRSIHDFLSRYLRWTDYSKHRLRSIDSIKRVNIMISVLSDKNFPN